MAQPQAGSLRLFHVAGIDVFVHWSWLLVAVVEIQARAGKYDSLFWNVAEYLLLFGIVLLHEFGHALACRQVGGIADRILLWPLGGVAYVQPPPRPGAFLWSIAAGPLVNVALVPVTVGLYIFSGHAGWPQTHPDADHFLFATAWMNAVLLVFNVLPVYPLDGGQILQALLWFVLGRAKSLAVASGIGLLCGAALLLLALWKVNWWFGILAAFIAMRSWAGFQQARLLAQLAKAPRYEELACPSCGAAPLVGPYWVCDHCLRRFDIFECGAVCPACGTSIAETTCPECQQRSPIASWLPAVQPADDTGLNRDV